MPQIHRVRLVAALLMALCSAAACVATLVEPQWFERLFDTSPDGGSGALETGIAVVLSAAACIAFSLLARREWRALARMPQH